MGDPFDQKSTIGPLVSQEQFDRVKGYLDVGKKEGAKVSAGGEAGTGKGYFVNPTLFSDVKNDMQIAREEIFGPVGTAISFTDENDAVFQGNNTDYGLSAAVWTRDISRAHKVARALKAGTVWVNCYQPARSDLALWRLQAVRLRPRTRPLRNRSLHADQVGLDEAVLTTLNRTASRSISRRSKVDAKGAHLGALSFHARRHRMAVSALLRFAGVMARRTPAQAMRRVRRSDEVRTGRAARNSIKEPTNAVIANVIISVALTERPAWKALAAHYEKIRSVHLRTLFADDPQRGERMALTAEGLYFDYSKHRITDETLRLLIALANESGSARSHRCDVPRRQNQRDRKARGPPHRSARTARCVDHGRREERRAGRPPSARSRWRTFPIASAAAPGRGIPASVSAPSSISVSAVPTSAR